MACRGAILLASGRPHDTLTILLVRYFVKLRGHIALAYDDG